MDNKFFLGNFPRHYRLALFLIIFATNLISIMTSSFARGNDDDISVNLKSLKSTTEITLLLVPSSFRSRINLTDNNLNKKACSYKIYDVNSIAELVSFFSDKTYSISPAQRNSFILRNGIYFVMSSGKTVKFLFGDINSNSEKIKGTIVTEEMVKDIEISSQGLKTIVQETAAKSQSINSGEDLHNFQCNDPSKI